MFFCQPVKKAEISKVGVYAQLISAFISSYVEEYFSN